MFRSCCVFRDRLLLDSLMKLRWVHGALCEAINDHQVITKCDRNVVCWTMIEHPLLTVRLERNDAKRCTVTRNTVQTTKPIALFVDNKRVRRATQWRANASFGAAARLAPPSVNRCVCIVVVATVALCPRWLSSTCGWLLVDRCNSCVASAMRRCAAAARASNSTRASAVRFSSVYC